MSAVLSTKNSSTEPILANGIFEGSYENITNFSVAVVTVYADTNSQLTVYQSQLGTVPASFIQYQIPPNERMTFNVQIAYPYLYVTLDNLDGSRDQTLLNLCTIYRNSTVVDVSGGGIASNVNIDSITPGVVFDCNFIGSLDVSVTFPSLTLVEVTNLVDVSVTNWPDKLNVNDSALLNAGSVLMYNGLVDVNQLSEVVQLTNGPVNGLSLYGTCYDDVSCRLQVMYSPNDTDWFGTQYVYQIDNSGDFGWNLPGTGASYVALKLLDSSSTVVAYGEYRA